MGLFKKELIEINESLLSNGKRILQKENIIEISYSFENSNVVNNDFWILIKDNSKKSIEISGRTYSINKMINSGSKFLNALESNGYFESVLNYILKEINENGCYTIGHLTFNQDSLFIKRTLLSNVTVKYNELWWDTVRGRIILSRPNSTFAITNIPLSKPNAFLIGKLIYTLSTLNKKINE